MGLPVQKQNLSAIAGALPHRLSTKPHTVPPPDQKAPPTQVRSSIGAAHGNLSTLLYTTQFDMSAFTDDPTSPGHI